jgi:DNA polymerase-3 subunit gamma/tau
LQQKGDKHATVGTFKIAQLTIINEFSFTISVNALTQQKFIEQEKALLIDYLQTAFNNRGINFTIQITETSVQQDVPIHLTLNSKQKFERIAQQYPLVKELRDRLKFDIEY